MRAAMFVMLVALTTALVWAPGCARRFDGTVYRDGDLAFRVARAPAGWRQIDASDALIAYRADASEATIAVGGRCNRDGDDVPLEALTQHLFMLFTDRDVKQQRKLEMDGREALRTTMVAKLDGVELGFVVYVLKKDGCVYDFMWIGRAQEVDEQQPGGGVEQFDSYVGAFRTLRVD